MDERWSDDQFLDEIRAHVDSVADDCVTALGTQKNFADIFQKDTSNWAKLPDDAPAALQEFFATTDRHLLLEQDLVPVRESSHEPVSPTDGRVAARARCLERTRV